MSDKKDHYDKHPVKADPSHAGTHWVPPAGSGFTADPKKKS